MRLNRSVLAMLALVSCTTLAGAQQYTFEQVAEGLKHTDAATRVRAIQILRDADYPEAAAPIGGALGDVDDAVQLAAIEAERSLFSVRPVSRRQRVGFIIEKRTSAAASDVAAEGQLALKARAVPTQVLAGLVLALSDTNPRVRGEAVALAALLTPAACPPARLESQHCAQIGNVLIENINSREAGVRRAAMLALGRLRFPHAVQALSDQLGYYQRGADAEAALEALAGIGHPASISVFEQTLGSSSANMRRLGVEGLARAGHKESLPALQQLAQGERSSAVLLALHYANVRLGVPGDGLSQIIAALRLGSVRALSTQYLLDLAPAHAVQLAQSLGDQDAGVRRVIAGVLGFSGDPRVIAPLETAYSDADPDVVLEAQRAVERLKLR